MSDFTGWQGRVGGGVIAARRATKRERFFRPRKKSTTIRLDEDLILFFKKKPGERKVGYQTLVNAALREYVHDHSVES